MQACQPPEKKLKIAVSWIPDNPDSSNYILWLRDTVPDAEIIILNQIHPDSVIEVLQTCHGLLITGGGDIHPGLYFYEEDTIFCENINPHRDELEMNSLKQALALKMPVLGICRGHQLINVFFGGSLYRDIPTQVNTQIMHRCKDSKNCHHEIKIFPGTILEEITGMPGGQVNSSHHQAIRSLGNGLKVVAVAEDGIIEAITRAEPQAGESFLLGVQWHPERMDRQSPFAASILARFLNEMEKFRKHSSR